MTEYLAFKQIFAKSRTVYSHKSILFAKTVAMDGLCKDFFPRACFSGQQDCNIRCRNLSGQCYGLLHTL